MMVRSIRTAFATLILMLVGAPSVIAQDKAPLDHDAYDRWNRIQGSEISNDGRWLVYSLVPGDGDATLVLRDLNDGRELSVPRGVGGTFTSDSRFLAFTIRPAEEAVDAAREEDLRPDQMPKDSLGVLDLSDAFSEDGMMKVARVSSFEVPDEGAHIAYHLEKPLEDESEEEAETPEPEAEEEEAAEEEGPDRDKDEGTPLVVRDLGDGSEAQFDDVTAYAFSEDGSALFYSASNEDGSADGVYRVDPSDGSMAAVLTGEGEYSRMSVGPDGAGVAFLTNRDDWAAEQPEFTLYLNDQARVDSGTSGVPDGWWVSDNSSLSFSDDGARLFFGTAPRPEPEVDDDTPEDERVVVDIWNWRDPYLQPMQLVQAEQERNRTYLAMIPTDGGSAVQLETVDMPDVIIGNERTESVALGRSTLPYRQLVSWDGTYADIYWVDVETGEREVAVEMVRGGGVISPDGAHVVWWDGFQDSWFAKNRATGEVVDIGAQVPHAVHDVLDDHPDPIRSYGSAGWTADGSRFILYDEFDIWAVDPTGSDAARSLTEGAGREQGIRFRYQRIDPDERAVPMSGEVMLSAFEPSTKRAGFFRDDFSGTAAPAALLFDDYRFSPPTKAEDADRFVFTRQSFTDFPDLWISDAYFGGMEKVSEANPQQAEFQWGTAELVEWRSANNEPLQGILYKPENFDPNEQYPMMVYFYERSSDGLNQYFVPSAGTSINRSFYVSRDYLLFVPDIPYRVGYPGESAVSAVVPGVLSLIDEGYVDESRIGVQGHSWGGYQIAYMITETDIFAAAEAGAPVSNMTSAYGGIRWASGMSRMFQYEVTQSRIGGTLWDETQRYIENSPVFFADKISTPLLMLHNDEDGAVPWYQGIEMFVAMRRLSKPVWMLNYNGEAHGLRRAPNQKDWTIRMQQFFDHYLQGAPPARWMIEGVPAILKGKELGLDLITEGPIMEEVEQPAPSAPIGGR